MKRNKIIIASLLTALMLGVGVNSKAFAQGSLFGKDGSTANREYAKQGGLLGSRNGSDVNITGNLTLGEANNENPTTEAPLGSGIVMLMAAGAGYALLKRKEEQQ